MVPPAWREVHINPAPDAAVQAVGRDRAGRWQYLYSQRQHRLRERRKRVRLVALLRALPELRTRVAADLRREGLPRERVLASMVRLLMRGFLRPGSQAYAQENGTFGLATLRPRHVRVRGARVLLEYPGKSHRVQRREIFDSSAARVVRALLAQPGRQVFRYRGDDGVWVDVRRRHINSYLRERLGAQFTAKDFRTWAGTLLGACALARAGYPRPPTKTALRRRIAQAMRETSALLGNTPAVCRASYVSPAVLVAFEKGRLLALPPTLDSLVRSRPRALEAVERRLVRLVGSLNGFSPARRRSVRP